MHTRALVLITLSLLSGGLLNAQKPIISKNPEPPGFHTLSIGDQAPDFSLLGVDGRTYSLADFKDSPCLMVIFLCNTCPVSHAAVTRLLPFLDAMKGKGLSVVSINPDNDEGLKVIEFGFSPYGETYDGMKAYARDQGFTFPYLYDGATQAAAKAYGCLCTPDVFIFDADRRLRYKGRFDDSDLPDPSTVHSYDAINAVKEVLAGKPVLEPETKPFGCATKWKMLKTTVVAADDAAWKALPVTVEPIDAASVAELARNPTEKLRVINLWATWCGPCVEEFPGLVSLARRLELRPFELITISLDDPKAQANVEQFLEKEHAAVPPREKPALKQEGRLTNNYLYTGPGKDALAQALDPSWPGPLPYTVVIAPGGKILARWSGAVDLTELRTQLIDILGGYHDKAKIVINEAL